MNIKNIALIGLTSIAFASNTFAWRSYDLEKYYDEKEQLHRQYAPFPLIFHYRGGRQDSNMSWFKITNKELTLNNTPQSVQNQLKGVDSVEIYEAFCLLQEQNCNYFTHIWSMDRMIENRITYVASGIYGAKNLEPIDGQIGINTLVDQRMSFHDAVFLSADSARFKIVDMNQVAEGWFVSYYDPKKNATCGNVPVNQNKKAIVVHWYFLPQNLADSNQELSEPYKTFNENFWTEEDTLCLKPQFEPAK